jgi:hypothetical protein
MGNITSACCSPMVQGMMHPHIVCCYPFWKTDRSSDNNIQLVFHWRHSVSALYCTIVPRMTLAASYELRNSSITLPNNTYNTEQATIERGSDQKLAHTQHKHSLFRFISFRYQHSKRRGLIIAADA